jgi:hypothetical protein
MTKLYSYLVGYNASTDENRVLDTSFCSPIEARQNCFNDFFLHERRTAGLLRKHPSQTTELFWPQRISIHEARRLRGRCVLLI